MKMETPAQRGARLIAALEDLVAQETAVLRNGDFDEANTVADRTAPIVEWLADHPTFVPASLQERLAAIGSQRARNAEFLDSEIARTREELQQVAVSRRRVAQIAPVYGRAAAQPTRLSAVG